MQAHSTPYAWFTNNQVDADGNDILVPAESYDESCGSEGYYPRYPLRRIKTLTIFRQDKNVVAVRVPPALSG